jgi:hypothetical protein
MEAKLAGREGGQSFRREACWLEESQVRARFGEARIGSGAERQAGLCGYFSDCGVKLANCRIHQSGGYADDNPNDFACGIFYIPWRWASMSLPYEVIGGCDQVVQDHGIDEISVCHRAVHLHGLCHG